MISTKEDDKKLYAIIDKNISDKKEDVIDLINLQYDFLNGNCTRLFIQFSDCRFINAAVAVLIGTLPVYSVKERKSVKYRFLPDRAEHPIFKFMKRVGMYKFFMKDEIDYTGLDAIPFNRIADEQMMDIYTEKIMNLAPIKMESEAKDILSSYIYEIYQNGFFHSHSPIGIFTSGFWMPNKKEFTFSIYDMGVGIPYTIRQHFKKEIDSEKCLRLAFLKGFTTSQNEDVNRGLGLYQLENFIRLNNGRMSMYTDDIYCIINGQNEKEYHHLEKPIKGTLIIINIVADENHIYKVG